MVVIATLFSDLFDIFLETEVTSKDLLKYNPPLLAKNLSLLLKRARSEFYNLAFPNPPSVINKMDDIINFYMENIEQNSTGVNSIQIQLLLETPTDPQFFIEVNGNYTSNYIYDSLLKIVTINGLNPSLNNLIDLYCYKDGAFNQTLSLIEEDILVDWMGVVFLKDKIKTQKIYNQAIYGKDEGLYSQANHLKELQNTYNENRKAVITKSIEYTYRNITDKTLFATRGGKAYTSTYKNGGR